MYSSYILDYNIGNVYTWLLSYYLIQQYHRMVNWECLKYSSIDASIKSVI